MAGGIDWFRWHHGSVTDPKFQLVARKSKQALDVFELEKLIDAIHTDPTGFSEHLRAFIGTTWAEPKGFCVA